MRKIFAKLLRVRCIHSSPTYSTSFAAWSPLANAFNERPAKEVGRNLPTKGLFDISELTDCNGFFDLKEQCIRTIQDLRNEATSKTRKRKMVQIFDDLSDNLCKVADLADFIRLAHPDVSYTQAAEQACGAVSSLVERLNTDKHLFDALQNVVQNGDEIETNRTDDHVAKLFLFDFEQSGIHLPEHLRNYVVLLNDQILRLGQAFVAQGALPRVVNRNSIPDYIQHLFTTDGNNIIINGLSIDSPNPVAREVAYKVYLEPEVHQEQTFNALLKARHELAVTCGFETYADRVLRGCMLDSPAMVTNFLTSLATSLKPNADKDFECMRKMKKREVAQSGPLEIWDVPYYAHKYKRDLFRVTSTDFSPYLSLGACMDGLNKIFTSLYGITLHATPTSEGEVWVSDVYKLQVVHEGEGLLGYIYCDFYERNGKTNQDCHFTIRGGRNVNGTYQLPVVVLMLNLPLPRWSTPTLLTPNMVDNLFHEMGHAMHSMLGRTQYQHVTGTRCSTDLAEVPSVLMEYFARDPRIVTTFARHFQTGEPMPSHMVSLFCASKNAFMASEMQMQMFYSMLDQAFHSGFPLDGTSTDVLARVQNAYYSLPHVENTAWHLRFSHLVGYGAKYYSYLVSTALASWIWQTYFNDNPLCRVQGERYRRDFLAHGGGKPPWTMISDFLQRDPTPTRLAESLINEIESKRDKLEDYVRSTN